MHDHLYIACDLGAESGRVILGRLRDGRLSMSEIHRFPTGACQVRGTLRWDIIRIWEELKAGLRKAAQQQATSASISTDSWGVDYVLVNKAQPMLGAPYHYRDVRTDKPFADAMAQHAKLIFDETGIQFMSLNTLYQMIAERDGNADVLKLADKFIFIADYMNYLFSGSETVEETLASTSQMYNPRQRAWSSALIETFQLPPNIFPQVLPAGTKLGSLLPAIANETGLKKAEVIATCSHDTGAAVAAVPGEGNDWAYLSSGTWSLIGVELPKPLVNEQVHEANFTNELGVNGTTRFLKNIVGLWILQECRREWKRQGQELEYAALNEAAGEAEPFRSLIHPNSPCFARPDRMPEKVAEFCRATNQPAPETPGQFVRCILESLALLYGQTLATIEGLTGRKINRLHIVGGGSQSNLLNQFAANATGREVIAGPVEATATGNILVQAMAMGHIESLEAARKVVAASADIKRFTPQEPELWEKARARFAALPSDL